MNAYELADQIDWHFRNACPSPALTNAANMLRQQADRIAELEDRLSMYEIKDLDKQFQTTDKPVAWLRYKNKNWFLDFPFVRYYTNVVTPEIPLYTTPQDQADRIAELEKQLDVKDRHITAGTEALELAMERAKNPYLDPEGNAQDFGKIADMLSNSPPVAWMDKRTNKCVVFINTPPSDDWIPLYTTPQIKELSDEEIIEVFESRFHEEPTGKINDEVIAFAKAILKKASEK